MEFANIAVWLEEACKSRNLSWRAASLGAGLGQNTVQDIIKKPAKRPNQDTCRKLAHYFGAPVDYVLRLGGHPAEKVNSAQARFESLIELIQDLPPGKQIELAQIANRFRGDKGEEFLLEGVIHYRRNQGEDTEMFGLRFLDKYFYVADLEDVPVLIPQKQIENPVIFLSRWALTTLYEAYVDSEDHPVRDQIEDWYRHRNRMSYANFVGDQQRLRQNILIEIQSVTFGPGNQVIDFVLDPVIQKYVDDRLKSRWIKDMNTQIFLPSIDPNSKLAEEYEKNSTMRSPLIQAIFTDGNIFGSEINPHELKQIITEHSDTEGVLIELMYAHLSWPLPEDHVPPSAFAFMQERLTKEIAHMMVNNRDRAKGKEIPTAKPSADKEGDITSQPHDS